MDSRRLPDGERGGLLRSRLETGSRPENESSKNALNLCDAWRDKQPALSDDGKLLGEYIFMNSVRPDNTDPMPLRSVTPGVGTIIIRFVGLLLVSVVVLALIWSR